MGWGCYKHEMDAGSEIWTEELAKLCEEKLKENPRTWGRNFSICPLCYIELEKALKDLVEAYGNIEGHSERCPCLACEAWDRARKILKLTKG